MKIDFDLGALFLNLSQHLSAVVDWQLCSCFPLQIWPIRLMRTSSLHFQPPTVTTLTVGAVRGWEWNSLGIDCFSSTT